MPRSQRLVIMVLLPVLVLALATPSVGAVVERRALPKIDQTEFHGLYFPAGLPGTGSDCPYVWIDPFFCTIDPGTQTALPGGRVRIRDMVLYELAFAYRTEGGTEVVEPRKTGYDIVHADAVLDESLTGPTWGTWELHSFGGEIMFTGRFVGRFENGIPAVVFFGRGTEDYEGQRMFGHIARELDADGYNMYGRIIDQSE